MDKREVKRYEMLLRVRDFGIVKNDAFPTASLGRETLDAINDAIKKLADSAAEATSATSNVRQSSTTKAVLRASLQEDLAAISRTARSMAYDRPGLDDKFRLPRGNNDQALLNAARAFISDAEPLAADFIRYDLAADFIADLKTDIDNFEKALSDQQVNSVNRTMTETEIDEILDQAMRAVRRLDAIVKNKFRRYSAVLAAWAQAKHIEKVAAATKAPSEPATT